MMPGQQQWECVQCNVINTHGDPPCCEEATKSILAFDQRFPSQRLIDIKQGVDHLWEESATWPRVSWWKRAMNRVRSWF